MKYLSYVFFIKYEERFSCQIAEDYRERAPDFFSRFHDSKSKNKKKGIKKLLLQKQFLEVFFSILALFLISGKPNIEEAKIPVRKHDINEIRSPT